jgi:hypothetical protein
VLFETALPGARNRPRNGQYVPNWPADLNRFAILFEGRSIADTLRSLTATTDHPKPVYGNRGKTNRIFPPFSHPTIPFTQILEFSLYAGVDSMAA